MQINSIFSECRGLSRVCDTTSHTHCVQKLRQFSCMSMLMYCIDDRCYLPLHCLITDLIDSCGGSTKLIRYLNRLGMCSSLDTLSRVIQQQASLRDHKGPWNNSLNCATSAKLTIARSIPRYCWIFNCSLLCW